MAAKDGQYETGVAVPKLFAASGHRAGSPPAANNTQEDTQRLQRPLNARAGGQREESLVGMARFH